MSKNKICVIGGGPAGLTSAIKAAENGYDVTLYEKSKIGDKIRCAEGFVDTLELLQKPDTGIRFKVEEMLVKCRGKIHNIDTRQVRLWIIDREEWQRSLANKAHDLGVKILENHLVTPRFLREIKSEYEWIIDGSGVVPVTSRLYRFEEHYTNNSGVTYQYTIEGNFTNLYKRILVGLEPHYTGYYWIFPKSSHEANMGIGVLKYKGQTLRNELDRILEKEGITGDYSIKQTIGGLCPNVIPKKIVYDNIILVGDSCGLTSPFHGGGIDLACISGKVAVETIMQNQVNTYKDKLLNIIGDKIFVEQELVDFWETVDFDVIDTLLGKFAGHEKFPYFIMNPTKHFKQLISLLKFLEYSKEKLKQIYR